MDHVRENTVHVIDDADVRVVPEAGIEPVPVDQRLLVNPVRRPEEDQADQPEPVPARHLPAEQRPASVKAHEEGEVPRQE